MRTARRPMLAAATATLLCAGVALPIALRARAAPSEEDTLAPLDPADGLEFGASVSVFGDTALVGAPNQGAGSAQGAAYVVTRAAGDWTQRAKLTALDGAPGDFFGGAVAIQGGTAVVGAQGLAGQQGAAYVFTGGGASWSQQQKLTPDDAAAFHRIGQSVAIDGDTVVLGAPAQGNFRGAAYVFVRTGTSWTQQAKLTATDGATSDQFGVSTAIAGDTVLVGAFSHDPGSGVRQGAAYVFTRTAGAWTQRAMLFPPNGVLDDAFGVAVALSGDTALVGAQLRDIGQNSNQGAAYVFTGSGATWVPEAQLVRTGGGRDESFGLAVALDHDTAVVGAIFAAPIPPALSQGAAVVFERTGTSWTQAAELTSSDLALGDQFGAAVALADGTAIVGAIGKSNLRGGAYAFRGLPAQALGVTTTKGSLVDSLRPAKDRVSVVCRVEFRATSDGAFDPATESIRVSIGGGASPIGFVVAAGDPAVRSRINAKKHTATYLWRSQPGRVPRAAFKLVVPATGPATLAATMLSADLPDGAAAGLIPVTVELGADAGSDRDAWRVKGAKRLFP